MTILSGRIEVRHWHKPMCDRWHWGYRVPTVLHRHALDLGTFTIFWGRRLRG